MMTDPIAAWQAFLASPNAPKTALSPLELDGYLTGIIVTPQSDPIMPTSWLPGLWSGDDLVVDDEQKMAALSAVMEHYNALTVAIDASLQQLEAKRVCDYRPMFLSGADKPEHEVVRSWVRGFWKSMTLAPETWSALAEGERSRTLIAPFVGFIDLEDQGVFEVRDDIEAVLGEDAAAIPQTILVLRKLANIRRQPKPPTRRSKAGRNDPCPCGSGRKYKRCCGRN